jgi:competence protein ComEA
MSFLNTLQEKVGFSRKEAIAIITLSATFLVGLGIRWLQANVRSDVEAIDKFDYSHQDSIYAERSRNAERIILQADSTRKAQPIAVSPGKPGLRATPRPININVATRSELINLPGIGPLFADRIIAYRNANGNFATIDQLSNVKGIGEKTLQRLRPFVFVK